jgi:hypothetical protein
MGWKRREAERYQQVDIGESGFVSDEVVVHEDEKIKNRLACFSTLAGSHDFP